MAKTPEEQAAEVAKVLWGESWEAHPDEVQIIGFSIKDAIAQERDQIIAELINCSECAQIVRQRK